MRERQRGGVERMNETKRIQRVIERKRERERERGKGERDCD